MGIGEHCTRLRARHNVGLKYPPFRRLSNSSTSHIALNNQNLLLFGSFTFPLFYNSYYHSATLRARVHLYTWFTDLNHACLQFHDTAIHWFVYEGCRPWQDPQGN